MMAFRLRARTNAWMGLSERLSHGSIVWPWPITLPQHSLSRPFLGSQAPQPPIVGFSTSTDHDSASTLDEANSTASSSMKMNDLVQMVAEGHDLSLAESRRILSTVFDGMTDALRQGHIVHVAHFGTFSTYLSKERMGRNPQTGAPLTIPAKTRIRFRPSSHMKSNIGNKEPSTGSS